MDSRTGHIYEATDAEAKKHDLVPIPPDELAHVQQLNRHDRRKWAALQRAKIRAAAKTSPSKRTLAHRAIEREIAALTTDEARLARCLAEAPDFALTEEDTDDHGMCTVARWTDRAAGRCALRQKSDGTRIRLLCACLYAMLLRDLP